MIYVNQNQLDQVQYLVDQSARGNHILFDADTIKRISRLPKADLEDDRTEIAEKLLEQLILCPTLQQKKMFLANLDKHTHDDVARVFLNIVANTAQERQDFNH